MNVEEKAFLYDFLGGGFKKITPVNGFDTDNPDKRT